jgi:lysophospholipase L1-like esterase
MDMRIVVLGDSIAYGLGVKGSSYSERLAGMLEAQLPGSTVLWNLSGSAMQISETMKLLPQITAFSPDLILLAHGVTEAIVRPSADSMKRVPARWRKPGWLDPRPYYSRRLMRQVLQKMESGIRWRLKVYLIRKFGGITWKTEEEFEKLMKGFVQSLLEATHAQVVLLTHCGIDERYFPGSMETLERYKAITADIPKALDKKGRVHFCDISGVCSPWSDFFEDHFHPNRSGHSKIAEKLHRFVETIQPGKQGLRALGE